MTLFAEEFIRRFFLRVLPNEFRLLYCNYGSFLFELTARRGGAAVEPVRARGGIPRLSRPRECRWNDSRFLLRI